MSILHHGPEDPGPTGSWSWPKFLGIGVGVLSLAPPVLWYLEVGPDMPWWGSLVFTGFLALLSVGVYRGLGKGAFQQMVDAGARRIGEGE